MLGYFLVNISIHAWTLFPQICHQIRILILSRTSAGNNSSAFSSLVAHFSSFTLQINAKVGYLFENFTSISLSDTGVNIVSIYSAGITDISGCLITLRRKTSSDVFIATTGLWTHKTILDAKTPIHLYDLSNNSLYFHNHGKKFITFVLQFSRVNTILPVNILGLSKQIAKSGLILFIKPYSFAVYVMFSREKKFLGPIG